jgi:hypothetical protein
MCVSVCVQVCEHGVVYKGSASTGSRTKEPTAWISESTRTCGGCRCEKLNERRVLLNGRALENRCRRSSRLEDMCELQSRSQCQSLTEDTVARVWMRGY